MFSRGLSNKATALLKEDPDYIKDEFDKQKIEIIKYCLVYNFKFRFINDLVFIYSLVDEWYFKYTSKDKVKLYHKNMKHSRSKYHTQGKFNSNACCMRYIKRHDDYLYKPSDKHKYKFNIVRTKLGKNI